MIGSDEVEIRGTARIETLVKDLLKELARDASGWDVLYADPHDGRLWELTYPESEYHGGGAPMLTHIASDVATRKYNVSTGILVSLEGDEE